MTKIREHVEEQKQAVADKKAKAKKWKKDRWANGPEEVTKPVKKTTKRTRK